MREEAGKFLHAICSVEKYDNIMMMNLMNASKMDIVVLESKLSEVNAWFNRMSRKFPREEKYFQTAYKIIHNLLAPEDGEDRRWQNKERLNLLYGDVQRTDCEVKRLIEYMNRFLKTFELSLPEGYQKQYRYDPLKKPQKDFQKNLNIWLDKMRPVRVWICKRIHVLQNQPIPQRSELDEIKSNPTQVVFRPDSEYFICAKKILTDRLRPSRANDILEEVRRVEMREAVERRNARTAIPVSPSTQSQTESSSGSATDLHVNPTAPSQGNGTSDGHGYPSWSVLVLPLLVAGMFALYTVMEKAAVEKSSSRWIFC